MNLLRTATRPKWLAILAALAVLVYVFFRLGLWQFHTGQSRALDDLNERAQQPPVALAEIVGPQQPFLSEYAGRMVHADGAYDPDNQFLVPWRKLGEQTGYWVITPLVEADTSARLPILRGFVTDPAQASVPPETPVRVTGALAQPEAPSVNAGLPEGQLGSVDIALLVNRWDGQVYNTFVFATAEDPPISTSAITPVPPPATHMTGLNWRNLGYAVQWWVFAAFAVFVVWKQLRDEATPRRNLPGIPTSDPAPAQSSETKES